MGLFYPKRDLRMEMLISRYIYVVLRLFLGFAFNITGRDLKA